MATTETGWGRGTWGSYGWGVGILITPDAGAVVSAGSAPFIDAGIPVPSGTATIQGYAPVISAQAIITPNTGAITATGEIPTSVYGFVTQPTPAALVATGQLPIIQRTAILTPTGGVAIVGSVPSVVVAGTVKVPGTVALSLVGAAPTIATSIVITPAKGTLMLAGSAPVISNPNWTNINDSQTPNWVPVAA